jgi:hypothetical protein
VGAQPPGLTTSSIENHRAPWSGGGHRLGGGNGGGGGGGEDGSGITGGDGGSLGWSLILQLSSFSFQIDKIFLLELDLARLRLPAATVLASLVDLTLESVSVQDDSGRHLIACLLSSACCPFLHKLC